MIIETSAMVAILYREPEAADFAQLIHKAEICRMSVASYVELAIVIEANSAPKVCVKQKPSSAALASSLSR